MPLKIIIAGGRNYQLTAADRGKLDDIWVEEEIAEVVSGGATGADRCGEQWASARGIPFIRFNPCWEMHGKHAGPIRNAEMADYADAVALFPGGRGTQSMYDEAKKRSLKIYDFRK